MTTAPTAPTTSTPTMIVGVDYGSVDQNPPPDFAKFAAACADAGSRSGVVILRAAWGAWEDPVIDRDWVAAGRAGLVRSAYLYLRRAAAGATPEAQVDALLNAVGRNGWPLSHGAGDLVPALDLEDDDPAASPAAELDWAHRAWRHMRDRVGAAPLIYTSARVWREVFGSPTAADPKVAEMLASPLWLAKPWPLAVGQPAMLSPRMFEGGALDPEVPPPWGADDWWLHQYQGDARPVPGIGRQADLSRFRGAQQGATGRRVTWIQQRVGAAQDGQFGPATTAAVQAFQAAHGLAADGVVGVRTFAELTWAPPSTVAQARSAAAAAPVLFTLQRDPATGWEASGPGPRQPGAGGWAFNAPTLNSTVPGTRGEVGTTPPRADRPVGTAPTNAGVETAGSTVIGDALGSGSRNPVPDLATPGKLEDISARIREWALNENEWAAKWAAKLAESRAVKATGPLGADGSQKVATPGTGTSFEFAVEPQHRCGLCGELFKVSADDLHWSTGRGPICPRPSMTASPDPAPSVRPDGQSPTRREAIGPARAGEASKYAMTETPEHDDMDLQAGSRGMSFDEIVAAYSSAARIVVASLVGQPANGRLVLVGPHQESRAAILTTARALSVPPDGARVTARWIAASGSTPRRLVENPTQIKWTIDELAATEGTVRHALRVAFKQLVGVEPEVAVRIVEIGDAARAKQAALVEKQLGRGELDDVLLRDRVAPPSTPTPDTSTAVKVVSATMMRYEFEAAVTSLVEQNASRYMTDFEFELVVDQLRAHDAASRVQAERSLRELVGMRVDLAVTSRERDALIAERDAASRVQAEPREELDDMRGRFATRSRELDALKDLDDARERLVVCWRERDALRAKLQQVDADARAERDAGPRPRSVLVPWPANVSARYNGSGEPCDMWTGSCLCGAFHRNGQ